MATRLSILALTVVSIFGSNLCGAQTTKMYWTSIQKNDIERADLDGSNKELLLLGIAESAVAYDPSAEKVYWINKRGRSIYRANVDGTSIEPLVTTGIDDPEDIEIDIVHNKLYWSDSGLSTIKRADLDGSDVEIIINASGPRGFTLDVANGYLYFTDLFGTSISRANLDGTDEVAILDLDSSEEAHDVAVGDTHIYWTVMMEDKIMRATLAGTGKADLATDIDLPVGIEIDQSNSHIYWSSRVSEVRRMNLDGTGDTLIGFTDGNYFDLDVANSRFFIGNEFDMEITRISFSGIETTVVSSAAGRPRGIALDGVSQKMYWADRLGDTIYRASLDGSSRETIVSSTSISNPQGVQLDLENGHLYWLDSGLKKIERVDLSDNSRTVVLTGTEWAENFALDVANGRVYLADFLNDRILSINLDGSEKQTRYTGTDFIWAIDIDRDNNEIYFTEGSVIKKGDMDVQTGALSNVTTIIGSGLSRPIGIRYFPNQDKIYWVDDIADKVQRADADGSNVETLVSDTDGAWGIDILEIPTPTPTPTSTPSPTFTSTPTSTPSPTQTNTPSPMPTDSPTATPTPEAELTNDSITAALRTVKGIRFNGEIDQEARSLIEGILSSFNQALEKDEISKKQKRRYKPATRSLTRFLTSLTKFEDAKSKRRKRKLGERLRKNKRLLMKALRRTRQVTSN